MESQNNPIPFEGKPIRKVWHNDEWYFVITDVIHVLTDTKYPKQYLSKMRKNDPELFKGGNEIGYPLLVDTEGGKQKMSCANTQGLLRIIMSVPSHKAEPLKQWLAQVGKERIEETENPELSYERMSEIYRAKGRTEKWIKERLQTINTRKQLTDEWKARGVKEGQEYGILTATIAKGTFGLTPSEHSEYKGLTKQNLRDHMTSFELILTALSEEATRFVAVRDDAQGFDENHDAAVKGGYMGGRARRNLEEDLGETIISKENFLGLSNETKKQKELPFDEEMP